MVLHFCVSVKADLDFWLASLSNCWCFGPGYKFEMFFFRRMSACKLIKHICSAIFIRPFFSCAC